MAANDGEEELLDCHIHLFDTQTYHYPWPPKELQEICRPFLLEDLEKEMCETQVRRAVFVQVNQTYEETDWILGYPDPNNTLAAIIGWVNLQDPQLESILDKYMACPKFKGVRNILEGETDDAWLERPDVLRGLGLLEKKGLTYDLLIRERHFKVACKVVKMFPKLKFIVDHVAKPNIKEGFMESWMEGICQLAQNPNVYCKISGMVTEACHKTWTVEDLKPYVKHVLSAFGPDRCLFGSDWPVCKLAGASYSRVYRAYLDTMDHLTSQQRRAVCAINGWNIYNIS